MHGKFFYSFVLTIFFCGLAFAQEPLSVFDPPLDKQIVPLGDIHTDPISKVTCSYYPQFMVKQVDSGGKGADKISMTPHVSHQNLECKQDTPGEIEVKDWAGYFAGVKGPYVFLNADDASNGGYPFAVFKGETGQKLFEDSRDIHANTFNAIKISGGDLVMRYRRVYHAECSLYEDPPACWEKIKASTHILQNTAAPECTKTYEDEQKRTPEYAKEIAHLPSMIGYETQAVYKEGRLTFTRLPGKISCWLP